VNASRTARDRVRAELIREITEIARRQLATEGASGLSLRAIAKEMGMVSSAVYRYFPNKDELLTTLIIDGYNAVGAAVEKADAACPTEDYAGRWLAACRAVRNWGLAHPHEYALVYGSPVPGYRAPERTIEPAARSAVVFGKIIGDAYRAGAAADLPGPLVPVPAAFAPDAARLRDAIMEGVPDHITAAALIAWSGLFGLVSFELFGQFENVVTDRAAFFDHAAASLGRLTGVPA
jgi:AcrR family transcriptional regulator